MQIDFQDNDLLRLYTDPSFRARGVGPELTKAFRKKVEVVVAARDERDLYAMSSLHFEKLKGDREGQHSIRLNEQWRLIVTIEKTDQGTTVDIIEIADYH